VDSEDGADDDERADAANPATPIDTDLAEPAAAPSPSPELPRSITRTITRLRQNLPPVVEGGQPPPTPAPQASTPEGAGESVS
jgi:hypothetical protein